MKREVTTNESAGQQYEIPTPIQLLTSTLHETKELLQS